MLTLELCITLEFGMMRWANASDFSAVDFEIRPCLAFRSGSMAKPLIDCAPAAISVSFLCR